MGVAEIVLLLLQDDPAALVEKLRSDVPEVREAATEKLKTLGKEARAALERAKDDSDPEVSSRVTAILRVIPVIEDLTPRIRSIAPDLEDRLVSGSAAAWLLAADDPRLRSAGLRPPDYAALISGALKRTPSDNDKLRALQLIRARNIRSAVPAVLPLLEDPKPKIRCNALDTIHLLKVGDAAEKVAPLIRDAYRDVRLAAIRALGALENPAFAEAVAPILDDKDADLAAAATTAYASMRKRAAVPELLRLMSSGPPPVCSAAHVALIELGSKEIHPAILKGLDSSEVHVRARAAEVAGRLYIRRAGPALARLLRDENADVRIASVMALEYLGGTAAEPDIGFLLEDDSGTVRFRALNAIMTLRAKSALPQIRKLLEGDANERGHAVDAFSKLAGRDAVPVLADLLDDPDLDDEAAELLAKLGAREYAPAIARLLGSSRGGGVRHDVIDALELLEAKEQAPDILPLLKAEDPIVRENGARALAAVKARDRADALIPLLDDGVVGVRIAAASALAKLGSPSHAEKLAALLTDDDGQVRKCAIYGVAHLDLERHRDAVKRRLDDDDPFVREAAAQALGEEALRSRLDDADDSVRCLSANRLLKLKGREAADAILKLFDSDGMWSRIAAIDAVDKLGLESAKSRLLECLEDREFKVRVRAARALLGFGAREGVFDVLRGVVLREGNGLRLNALRLPDAWKRLQETPWKFPGKQKLRDSLAAVADQAGLKIEFPDFLLLQEQEHLDHDYSDVAGDGRSCFEALEALAAMMDRRFEIIIESDHIRVMLKFDALDFWEAWWASQK